MQVADAAAHNRPRGNLSDLYPRWLGARELLLRGRNPYSSEITIEIQKGYYGRALDTARPEDPKDQQGFAYPVYVVFILAPVIGFSFHTVQTLFHWLLIGITAASVLLWLRTLPWKLPRLVIASCVVLTLGSVPAVQGIKLQQLSLLVAALLAASAASAASGFPFLGGSILALATIKPQLAWPLVAWLLLWAASEWKTRRRLVFGFATMMALLLIASEVILPGWWRMFLQAVRQYHQYTQNESILELMLGPLGGMILAAIASLGTGGLVWKLRHEQAGSEGLGGAIALVLTLTVLVVPMYAPYNQVLLLPAILLLARDSHALTSSSRSARVLYVSTCVVLIWPWLASMGLAAAWLVSSAAALRGWKLPFYATFVLPLLVFALALLDAQRRSRGLRVRDAAE